jgi:Helix-turn-helix domain
MTHFKHGLVTAAREHLLEGKPITRLEAIVLYGVPDLTKLISDMRRQGWTIHSKKISYVAAARRVNQHAVLRPPENLPVKEIQLTEYWVSK